MALRPRRRLRAGCSLANITLTAVVVLMAHQDERALVFLPILAALFAAVGDHFVPVAFTIGLGSGFELALLIQRQGSPSLADKLAELLEVVLL